MTAGGQRPKGKTQTAKSPTGRAELSVDPDSGNPKETWPGSADTPGSTTTLAPVYLRPIVEEAARAGFDARALFHGLAFSASDLDVPGFMVSHAEAVELIRRALRVLDNSRLGLDLGMHSKITDRGALALGILAARTLGDAIALTLQFPRSAGYLLMISEERSDNRHALTAEPLHGEHDLVPFLVDLTFAGMVHVRRQVASEDYSPTVVEFVRKRPANASAYARYFRGTVHFGCLRNRLVSDLTWLDFALPMANAMSYRLSVQLLEREAEHAGSMSAIGQAVERAIRRALPMMAGPAEVAASLNLSVRTLRRKLADEGISYSGLVDAGRRARALELMVNGRRSFAEVAAETGFADARSFRRAFKRWTGVAPSELPTVGARRTDDPVQSTA
jgi:AraC-like DNA-binding protein